jgi:hypothetical protein
MNPFGSNHVPPHRPQQPAQQRPRAANAELPSINALLDSLARELPPGSGNRDLLPPITTFLQEPETETQGPPLPLPVALPRISELRVPDFPRNTGIRSAASAMNLHERILDDPGTRSHDFTTQPGGKRQYEKAFEIQPHQHAQLGKEDADLQALLRGLKVVPELVGQRGYIVFAEIAACNSAKDLHRALSRFTAQGLAAALDAANALINSGHETAGRLLSALVVSLGQRMKDWSEDRLVQMLPRDNAGAPVWPVADLSFAI